MSNILKILLSIFLFFFSFAIVIVLNDVMGYNFEIKFGIFDISNLHHLLSSSFSDLITLSYLVSSYLFLLLMETLIFYSYPSILFKIGAYNSIWIYLVIMIYNMYRKDLVAFAVLFLLLIQKCCIGTGISEHIWIDVSKEFYRSIDRMTIFSSSLLSVNIFNSSSYLVFYLLDILFKKWKLINDGMDFVNVNLIFIYLFYNLISIGFRASWIRKFASIYNAKDVVKESIFDISMLFSAIASTFIMKLFEWKYQIQSKFPDTKIAILLGNTISIISILLITNIIDITLSRMMIFANGNRPRRATSNGFLFSSKVIYYTVNIICIFMTIIFTLILYGIGTKIDNPYNLTLITNLIFLSSHLIMEPLLGWMTFLEILVKQDSKREIIKSQIHWLESHLFSMNRQISSIEQV